MGNSAATRYADIQEFTAISIIGHAQSCIGVGHAAIGWGVNYLGVSAVRTADALEGDPAKTSNRLAALVWDLTELGILPRA